MLAGIFVLRMITPNRIQEEKLGLAPGLAQLPITTGGGGGAS